MTFKEVSQISSSMHLIKISVLVGTLRARTGFGLATHNSFTEDKQTEKLMYPLGWPLDLLEKTYLQKTTWHVFSHPPYTYKGFTLRIRQRKAYNRGDDIER